MAAKFGFTLLELLVVMLIIAILAGLGVKGYSLARRQAKESAAKAGIEKLRSALEEYRVEYGRYPEQLSEDELDFLTNAVEGVEVLDPWGNSYQYQFEERFVYRIWSTGQDLEEDADNIDPSQVGY